MSNLLIGELIEIIEETNTNKILWVRKWIARRNLPEGSALVLNELYIEDPVEYKLYLRISPDSFDTLLNLIGSQIQKTYVNDC